ncbi:DUF962-domain-containing protein [Mytilinidion resinicola]|uniref:DUF962-domain-containing protein n=1 Tax=Mytilinidion resinicola TaxID=574789 RepID=A0A6A6YG79_9PEZI|nr:DUF962-domain-containing protein [Mytilinidion resinicola]KAF2806897.1 DUF962-domain-containing protein [Mytilinidion resinicola]
MSLNLEKQLLFYGAYHSNPVNIGIHITCVPIILVTFMLLATNSPNIPLPSWLSIPYYPLNLGTVAALLYSTLYVLMEPVAGTALSLFIIPSTAYSNYLTSIYGAPVNYWAAGINAVAWILQFIGHGKFEGRAPALLDNLVQALFLAPLFVWLEVLFYFGYRPELRRRLDKGVEQEIRKFKQEKEAKANGAKKTT